MGIPSILFYYLKYNKYKRPAETLDCILVKTAENTLTILSLLEELGKSNTAAEELLCGGVQVWAELSKGGDLTVLSQL